LGEGWGEGSLKCKRIQKALTLTLSQRERGQRNPNENDQVMTRYGIDTIAVNHINPINTPS